MKVGNDRNRQSVDSFGETDWKVDLPLASIFLIFSPYPFTFSTFPILHGFSGLTYDKKIEDLWNKLGRHGRSCASIPVQKAKKLVDFSPHV